MNKRPPLHASRFTFHFLQGETVNKRPFIHASRFTFHVLQGLKQAAGRAWALVRALSGDDSYERYLEHARACHGGVAPLDRRHFYLREQERRFSGSPTRCC